MIASNPTRRAILGAAPAAVIATMIVAPAVAAPAGVSPTMSAAIAHHLKARADLNAFRELVFQPVEDAFHEAKAAIPHHTTVNSFTSPLDGKQSRLSTDGGAVSMARRVLAGSHAGTLPPGHRGRGEDADYFATLKELADAADAREIEEERLNQLHGYDAVEGRLNDFSDADSTAMVAVIETPAASLADLLAKVEWIEANECWDMGAVPQVVADVRRLGGIS